MKYALTVAMAIVLVAGVALAQEGARAPAPELPDEVLAVVEIPNLATFEQHLRAYVGAVKPGAPMPPLAVGLVKLTKLANPAALDNSRPQRLLVVESGAGGSAVVSVLHATDTQAYMNGLLPTLKKTEVDSDITLFTEGKRSFDRAAYQKATPEARRNVQDFMKVTEHPVAIGVKEKFVCVGKDKACVATALALIEDGALADEPLLAGGDLAAYVRVENLLASLMTPAGGPFDDLREKVKGFAAMGGQAPQAGQMQAILNAEIDALEALVSQIGAGSARLSADGTRLGLSIGIEAVPGSALGDYLASVPEGRPETLKFMPQDAFLVAALKMGNMEALGAWVAEFQTTIMAVTGTAADEAADAATAAQEIMRAYGDEISFAMRPGKGIQGVEVIRMKDAGAAKEATGKMPLMLERATQMYKNMGISMQLGLEPEALTHKDHQISEWRMSFDLQPPEGADPQTAAMLAQQRRAMAAMFGDAMTFHSTILDRDWLITIGGDSLQSLQVILDGTYAKLTDHPAFQQALASVPADGEGVIYLYLTDLVQWGMSLAQSMSGGMMPPMMANLQFQRGPGIVAGIDISAGRAACNVSIPAAEIKSVVDGFQKGMGAPGGMPPPG